MVRKPASCAPHEVSVRRHVAVDGDGSLSSLQGPATRMTSDQVFAVLVLWDEKCGASWLGWLTTKDHSTACFTVLDLEDPLVARWIGGLPGWDQQQLSLATTLPGLHLVWRCRE